MSRFAIDTTDGKRIIVEHPSATPQILASHIKSMGFLSATEIVSIPGREERSEAIAIMPEYVGAIRGE